jgi:GT2 family glycosyltransferase
MEKIAFSSRDLLSISVVSHGQMDMIAVLMQDIREHCSDLWIELILTLNIEEPLTFRESDFFYPITVIRNLTPKGFGANHNQAFKSSHGDYFCILNPDIRLLDCPFPVLIKSLKDASVGVVAPLVLSPVGSIDDSARHFPSLKKIFFKLFTRRWTSDYTLKNDPISVDWVAGMFMLLTKKTFEQLGGFNERYFLYYEDVDICARLNLAGLKVMVNPAARVVHYAQHSSHRSLRYLRWHLSSLYRFLTSHEYRQLKQLGRI